MSDKGSSSERVRDRAGESSALWTVTVAVAAVAVGIVVWAYIELRSGAPSEQLVPVLQDVLTTAYQAIVVGALAGAVKLIIDRNRERARTEDARLQLRQTYIQRVVGAMHRVDTARMLIQAEPTSVAWSEQVVGGLIPARSEIRLVKHEVHNWSDARRPIFQCSREISDNLGALATYVGHSIWEYARARSDLAGQPPAAPLSDADLPRIAEFAGLMSADEDVRDPNVINDFGVFRDTYEKTLVAMRSNAKPTVHYPDPTRHDR